MGTSRTRLVPEAHRVLRLLALLALMHLSNACSGNACEQRRTWRNQSTSACLSCLATNCEHEQAALVTVSSPCSSDLACAARCPDQSALTCGCIDQCLVTMRCAQTYDALTACAVAHCSDPCH